MAKRRGASYQKRVTDINRIYDQHAKSGISNREIWRRFVYPVYAISERTFYNLLNASCDPKNEVPQEVQTFLQFDFDDESGRTENNPQYPKRH
ncbi:hypothetical protein [Bacteroides uniformis]|uniref:hypothetical protein n=1 Tax=Bacteroides uniformis TaxID=820 RepID=UPI00189774A9|nr:hypothetical protein [Bacteroides uniformis]MDC1957898.1 hypothetical protein [Bacteroides uniformis]